MNNKLLIITGPTCVGKSAISIKIAKILDTDIISCDSMQIYKYMDIGTAKLKQNEMQNINHYMIDLLMPNEKCDIKFFSEQTKKYIQLIHSKNKIPIIVGGSGFYLKSIIYDNTFLEENEEKKNNILDEINNKINQYGFEKIYEELKICDKESAEKININNKKRVIRALEFYKLHNKKISQFNKEENEKKSPYDYKAYVLYKNNKNLYSDINNRVDKMIQDGLLLEICNLINKNININNTSMQGIGYKELFEYCLHNKKEILEYKLNYFENINDKNKLNNLKDIIETIKQKTRNYAKRQLTWFRAQKNFIFINIEEYNNDENEIVNKIIKNF